MSDADRSIIAIDPALKCTGYAILSRDGSTLRECGTITDNCPKGDAYERAKSIVEQALDIIEKEAGKIPGCRGVAAVVVESPRDNGAGMRGKRSAKTAPNYGIIVGAMTYAVEMLVSWYGFEVIRPSASLWTRGYPGTKNDPHKVKRVWQVEGMYSLPKGALGCKTKAGNAADAVLMGRWAANRIGATK